MCGIIAVLRRADDRVPPASDDLVAGLDRAATALGAEPGDLPVTLAGAADAVELVDGLLRGVAGVRALVDDPTLSPALEHRLKVLDGSLGVLEAALDAGELEVPPAQLEAVNANLVRLKDAIWAVRHDRLRTADAVADLAGPDATPSSIAAYTSVQVALSAIDRLEVRGRDSAGLHLLVDRHGLDLGAPDVGAALVARSDPLFTSGAVRAPHGRLAFVYKAAAEIGELGDNTRALREAIRADDLLRRAVAGAESRVTVLGHTRWASVGIISEANAHPLNQEELGGDDLPYVAAALNGDVDNHEELRALAGLRFPPEVTTDAKVIPSLVARQRVAGAGLVDSFRSSVASFEGSVAIAASPGEAPEQLLLALRGSGQALYVGLADDAYVVASEPYGLVEVTDRYVRMDGETPSGADGVQGQVVVLDAGADGAAEGDGLAGLRRLAYDGTDLPVGDEEVHTAGITTRDIDRGGAPHFLLKEISESPQSIRKTLRGKIDDSSGRARVRLPAEALPPSLAGRLKGGQVRRILVTGQGTAAVAGQAVASAVGEALADTDVRVSALPATELSGFGLDDDMADALVVAISQSGTTTDTNRTVDLVRSRGAGVIGIVNRRNSDLVEKADGVLYTSDGRDVEMAVPSTKAFYAQVAAGHLLALAMAEAAGVADRRAEAALLEGLRQLPDAMEQVLALRPEIADAAHRHAPSRRYWAVVGSGRDRIAAEEVRIKLSELCYKSISCDATEDKKHIDLSSEPLILLCGAGLRGANASDVAKEVAIYRAHKAAPIVVATEGHDHYPAALHVIAVPEVHPALAFVLSAMVGHLFGYEAALAIDAQALPLRQTRALLEDLVAQNVPADDLLDRLGPLVEPLVGDFWSGLRAGSYNGHLEAATAVRLTSLLRYVTGIVPVEAYELEHGGVASPARIVEDFASALTDAIEELTRPIDAIKHQAKTVTVGISRADDVEIRVPLVAEVLAAGAPRDRLGYRVLRTLARLDPAVASVEGYTRYQVEGEVTDRTATLHVVDSGGVASGLRSRTEDDPRLRGTKHRVASERQVTVARGASDGRTLVIVPEIKDNQVTGLTLLHARFHDTLPPAEARAVLTGYKGRYSALVDAVTETEPVFDDSLLAEVPMIDLLVAPVLVLAERWRGR